MIATDLIFGRKVAVISKEFNLIIGNLKSVTTPAQLAAKFYNPKTGARILESDITAFAFEPLSGRVSARINLDSYQINFGALRYMGITYFMDLEDRIQNCTTGDLFTNYQLIYVRVRGMTIQGQLFYNRTSVQNNILPNWVDGITHNNAYYDMADIQVIYAPQLIRFRNNATTYPGGSLFYNIRANGRIWVHPDAATVNGGTLDGNIAYLKNNKGWTVSYGEHPTILDEPNVITDLRITGETANSVDVAFTSNSVNQVISHLMYLNGVFVAYNSLNTYTFSGLTAGNQYTVEVLTLDEFRTMNISNLLTFIK